MTNAQIQEKRIRKARIFISPKELDDELLREYNEIETVATICVLSGSAVKMDFLDRLEIILSGLGL